MWNRYCLLVVGMLGLGSPVAAADGVASDELVRALRDGGYNIYFRHAQTEWSQSDRIEKRGDWSSCDPDRVRQLSAAGRDTARAVGEAIRALDIPVGRVLASPYCRAVDTARLMELGPVETTTAVMNMRAAEYVGGRDTVIRTARELLSTPPPARTNTVIAAHGNVARAATPVYPGEAEGVVFRPEGNGEFSFIGRLTPAQWTELAAAMSDD
ncbi:MAG: histidine phosphatase family protein [Gammaproteobacteria bacterium]|nr:histidine phosphatase family protein [Gammaproteobacteria bacterium]